MEGNWDAIRRDLDRLPIEGVLGSSPEEEITAVLDKYGVRSQPAKEGRHYVSVEIWGSGKPMREFLWSEDMADACVFLMENRDFKDLHGAGQKEIRNTHINIGTGKEISIQKLAETIKNVVGFEGGLYFNSEKPDGTMRKLTDSSKLAELGWKYNVELQEGIENIYNWYIGK